MDRLSKLSTPSSVLFASVFLLLAAHSECKLFKVVDGHNQVCAMLDTDFTITFSALQSGSKPVNVTFDQDYYRNYILGDCGRKMAVHIDKSGAWNFHVYLKFFPILKYMLHRSVTFRPDLVFGKVAPSNKTLTFVNPQDAPIGPVDCSYKCSEEEEQSYKKSNKSSSFFDTSAGVVAKPFVYSSAIEYSKDVTYAVLVDVKHIQIQVSRVHHEKFGPPISCPSSQ